MTDSLAEEVDLGGASGDAASGRVKYDAAQMATAQKLLLFWRKPAVCLYFFPICDLSPPTVFGHGEGEEKRPENGFVLYRREERCRWRSDRGDRSRPHHAVAITLIAARSKQQPYMLQRVILMLLAQMLVGRCRSRCTRQQYEQGDAQGQSVGEARVDARAVFGECPSCF